MGIRGIRKDDVHIGSQFERLTVIAGPFYENASGNRSKLVHWQCRCICGNETRVCHYQLVRGKTRSCGCIQVKHGETRAWEKPSPEWVSWTSMRHRCDNPRNAQYPRYGGRGISVCERWEESYANFLEDMGRRPTLKHSLDRINVNGPYSPENCKWSTSREQSRNKTTTVILEFNGERLCVRDWSDRTGVSHDAISKRIKAGWSVERTLTTPPSRGNSQLQYCTPRLEALETVGA
jgi:hypothetical protein